MRFIPQLLDPISDERGQIKTLSDRTEYFVRFDDDGRCLAYYRKRYEKESLFEEVWNCKYKTWKHIPARIIWMQISGECSLTEVSSESFKQLLPEAFETRENTL